MRPSLSPLPRISVFAFRPRVWFSLRRALVGPIFLFLGLFHRTVEAVNLLLPTAPTPLLTRILPVLSYGDRCCLF